MKALRISLAFVALLALTVLLATSTLSKPAGSARHTTAPRVAPTGLLSDRAPASALSDRRNVGRDTVHTPIHRPRTDCLTSRAGTPVSPYPARPTDPGIDNLPRLERHTDLVRVVPNPKPHTPARTDRARETGSLDQGNDNCPATVIGTLPYHDRGTLQGMHDNVAMPCAQYGNFPDVIYTYTPTRTALYAAEAATNCQVSCVNIRCNNVCPGTTNVGCSEASSGSTARVVENLIAGVTYYIVVDGDTTQGRGTYSFSLTAASACAPDFDLTAPGTLSGNTCFQHDDCPMAAGDDQMVRVTIPHTGYWSFSMCDGELWEANLLLSLTCCADSAIVSANYNCDYQPPYYISRPVISSRLINAGVYYLDIEGANDGECGAWTLTVDETLPCTTRPPNDDCLNAGAPMTLPATFTGNNVCATRDCALLTDGVGETWHAFQVDAVCDVVIDECGVSSGYWELSTVLATGCPCQSLIRTTESDMYNACGTEVWGPMVVFRNMQPGIYYYPVIRDSIYGIGGPYSIHVRTMPVCQVDSQPGDVAECFESADLLRRHMDCNGGCDVGPASFQTVSAGETIFGRCISYIDANNHRQWDNDWFELTLEDTGRISVTVDAEFPYYLGIYDRDCSYPSNLAWDYTVLPCSTLTLTTTCLRPHVYAINLQPSYNAFPRDSAHYRLTVNVAGCQWPVVLTQHSGDVPENEPICSDNYHDSTNAGCDGSPSNFEPIACGDTIFGTSGVFNYGSSLYRDMDWFGFTISAPSMITMSVVAEFNPYLIISNYCPGCDGGLAECGGLAGDTVRAATYCVPPGNYIAGVFPNDWPYLPCGTPYRMWITCQPCAPCTDIRQPADLVENEPPCSTWASNLPDHFNGGCNSDPPAFGPQLQCGQTIWGKSGDYYAYSGPVRDTDWMLITLTSPETPHFCVVAQFPVITAIVGPGGGNSGCDQVMLYSDIGTGSPCDTVCVEAGSELPPGNYWLYVAPNAYTGIVCGSEYRAWVTCSPCIPRAVSDLTARRDGDNVVLHWSADPAFAGTYNVYHTATYAEWPSGNWQLLAQNVAPVVGSRDMFVHTGAAQTFDGQYYAVVRVCP